MGVGFMQLKRRFFRFLLSNIGLLGLLYYYAKNAHSENILDGLRDGFLYYYANIAEGQEGQYCVIGRGGVLLSRSQRLFRL